MPYSIMSRYQRKEIVHPFGRLFESINNGDVSIARVEMTDDKMHYHKKTAEIYYVISGCGKIQLDNDIRELYPDTCADIMPNTRHRATADKGFLDIIVISSPPYDPKGVFYD